MSSTASLQTLPPTNTPDGFNAFVMAITSAVVTALQPMVDAHVNATLANRTAMMPAAPESEWMTVKELATALRCKDNRIHKLRCEGRIPDEYFRKDGARSLIHRDWLELHLSGKLVAA